MESMDKIREEQRAQGTAAILAIGTATPPFCVIQDEFPDMYSRMTKSEHLTKTKEKFREICKKTMVKRRYVCLDEEKARKNSDTYSYSSPSLDARQDFTVHEVPKLGMQAASEAIKEWGRPKSEITHLIFCTYSALQMPGMDAKLLSLLGLNPTVKRTMLYLLGCYAGGTVLRHAKDIAENNRDARVLVVCSEVTAHLFRGPPSDRDEDMKVLVEQTLFGDGAASVIVGCTTKQEGGRDMKERPLFQLVSTDQMLIPNTEDQFLARVSKVGQSLEHGRAIPGLIADNIEKALDGVLSPLGSSISTDWNSMFWVAHPGGPQLLFAIEKGLGLKKEKLEASWRVLSEYGNMSSSTVFFVLDDIRKNSFKEGKATTGQGFEWGVLFGFGPGLTIETILLRSVPI